MSTTQEVRLSNIGIFWKQPEILDKENQEVSALRTHLETRKADLDTPCIQKEETKSEVTKKKLSEEKESFETTLKAFQVTKKYAAILQDALDFKRKEKTPTLNSDDVSLIKGRSLDVYIALMSDPTTEKNLIPQIEILYHKVKHQRQKLDENLPKLERAFYNYRISIERILNPSSSWFYSSTVTNQTIMPLSQNQNSLKPTRDDQQEIQNSASLEKEQETSKVSTKEQNIEASSDFPSQPIQSIQNDEELDEMEVVSSEEENESDKIDNESSTSNPIKNILNYMFNSDKK